jgi:hypothetical protein
LSATTYSVLTERHKIYLVACAVTEEGVKRYNVATLYSPDGHALGSQRQTHLSPEERAAGLSRGEELTVFESPVGRLGLLVNTDVRYPEVTRILCLKGANVLVNPLAARGVPAHDWKRRLWREVAPKKHSLSESMSERLFLLERVKGFEPSTLCLGSRYATPASHPRSSCLYYTDWPQKVKCHLPSLPNPSLTCYSSPRYS